MNKLLFLLLAILLSGCTNPNSKAVVTDIWRQPIKSATTYVVQSGDTLYSIAWGYGLDYRQVAAANGINPPAYHIEVGQKLKLTPAASSTASKSSVDNQSVMPSPVQQSTQPTPAPAPANSSTQQSAAAPAVVAAAPTQIMSVRTVTQDGIAWAWPAQGRLINSFSANGLDKGIDIAGQLGAPVVAAASGKVVYAGSGLRGYGALIIIKHNDEFLSAYAHNQKLLVQEGQSVKVGQIIARMGDTEAKCVMLHFEIRKAGKPVDPQSYLPSR